jgi:deazaflavin-dependent oxidoreductase (nitroreductase family)
MDYEEFTRNMKAELRANGGVIQSGPMAGRPLMILTTTGAKSGEPREAVVTFTREGDSYVIAASKSGADTNPHWYHNLQVNPVATVEAGGEKFQARATEASGEERDRLYAQHAEERPEFKDYPNKTKRVIPIFTLDRLN